MALFRQQSRFKQCVGRHEFYDAYMELVNDRETCEQELAEMKSGTNVDAFKQYLDTWQQFCDAVIEGEFDKAHEPIRAYGDNLEFKPEEIRTVIGMLAESTSNYNCYLMTRHEGFDETNIDDLDFAVNMLVSDLPDCEGAYAEANRLSRLALAKLTQEKAHKREFIPFLESMLNTYRKRGTNLYDDEATELLKRLMKLDKKNETVTRVDKELIRSDVEDMKLVLEEIENEQYLEAFDKLYQVNPRKPKRVAFRGVWDNWQDDMPIAQKFFTFAMFIADRTGQADDCFYAASCGWGPLCDLDECIVKAHDYGVRACELEPDNIEYKIAALDGLYLMHPYPMQDDVAMKLANEVLAAEPENEIAKECRDIAEEQMQKRAIEGGK